MKQYSNKTARENWQWFLIYHGDVCCERCGYSGVAVDFHHLDPEQKVNARDTLAVRIASYQFRKWIRDINYAFLCSNCHRELHAGVWEIAEIMPAIKIREAAQATKHHLFMTQANSRLLDAILHSTNREIPSALRNTSPGAPIVPLQGVTGKTAIKG